MRRLDPLLVRRAHRNQTLSWIQRWAYMRRWSDRFPEMLLWYATAGLAVMQCSPTTGGCCAIGAKSGLPRVRPRRQSSAGLTS